MTVEDWVSTRYLIANTRCMAIVDIVVVEEQTDLRLRFGIEGDILY